MSAGGPVVGIGTDLVDLDRFREVLAPHARRSSTGSSPPGERAYAERRGDPTERYARALRGQGGGDEGPGRRPRARSSWHDIEVRARRRRARPSLRAAPGGPPRWPPSAGVGEWMLTLTHTDTAAQAIVVALGPLPVARRHAGACRTSQGAVGGRAGRRARADRDARRDGGDRPGRARAGRGADRSGRGRGRPGRRSTCSAAPTAAGSWCSPARATTATTGATRPAACGPRGVRVTVIDAADGARAAARRRPRDRRGLRHRVPGRVPAAGRAAGRAGAGGRHPVRGRRPHRRGAAASVLRGRSHRHLRRPQAGPAARRRARALRARSRSPTSASTSSGATRPPRRGRRRRRLAARPAGRRPQVAERGVGRRPAARAWAARRRSCARRRAARRSRLRARVSTPGGRRPPALADRGGARRPARRTAGPPRCSTDLDRFGAVVVGNGLGTSPRGRGRDPRASWPAPLERLPTVVDADGLTALGPDAADVVGPTTVLTPHDGEFARLAGEPPGADRIAAARGLAARTGARRAAQGPGHGGGRPRRARCWSTTTGDARLATAGTGDVLAGVIGGLLR